MSKASLYTLLPKSFLEIASVGLQPHIFSELETAAEANDIYPLALQQITEITDACRVTGPWQVNLVRYFKVFYWEYLTEVYALDLALGRLLDTGSSVAYLASSDLRPHNHRDMMQAALVSSQVLNGLRYCKPNVQLTPIHSWGTRVGLMGPPLRRSGREVKDRYTGLAARFRFRQRDATEPPAAPRPIAFGNDYDALAVVADSLRLAGDGRAALWMTEAVSSNTTRAGLSYRAEYDALERFSVRKFLTTHPVTALTGEERHEADSQFDALMRQLQAVSVLNRYRLVPHLASLRREFRLALQRTKALDAVLRHFSGSTIVLTDVNGLDERVIEQLAPQHQIKVLSCPHGWITNPEGYDYSPDAWLLPSELWRATLAQANNAAALAELRPDPNLTRTVKAWLGVSPSERAKEIAQRRTSIGIRASHVLLFMTTGARPRILNEFNFVALQRLWHSVFAYLRRHNDTHVLVKSHRNNFDDWVRQEAATHGVTNVTVLGGRLEDALTMADLVVDLGKPGTATFVALLFQKPLLLYQGLYKYVRGMGQPTLVAGARFVVQGPEALLAAVDQWRQSKTTYEAELQALNAPLRSLLTCA